MNKKELRQLWMDGIAERVIANDNRMYSEWLEDRIIPLENRNKILSNLNFKYREKLGLSNNPIEVDDLENKPIGNSIPVEKVLTKENCPHPSNRIRENISGGRFDECLDCGKTWG